MSSHDEFLGSESAGDEHRLLAGLVGRWEGTTRTWFEPDKLADESPSRGQMRSILGGRFLLHEYEGALKGEPFEGVAIYGYHADLNRFESAWVNSFHMGTGILFSKGPAREGGLSVLGGYAAGDGPDWGWRTELKVIDANHIVITAYNITPDGQEAKAVEATLARQD